MPAAIAFGCDPVLMICSAAAVHHPYCSEYEIAGGMMGTPMDLANCQTRLRMIK